MTESIDAVDVDERIDELYDRAREIVETILTDADEDDASPVVALLDDLEDVADEAEDILDAVDLTELAAAIEWSEISEAFDLEDVADAVRDDSEAVTARKLLSLVNLTTLWENVDARALWREKRELEDEVDDLTDDRDEEADHAPDISAPGGDAHDFDPESVEKAVQSQLSDATGTFREKLLATHERLGEIRRENAERFPDRRDERSRNPTAVSTLPGADSRSRGVIRHSTVPEETRYSRAPNRRRIYGPRFESAGGGERE